jgi:hypothetical protein
MDDFREKLRSVKLAVLDLDGTVLDGELRPHPRVIEAIERLRDRVRFTLATGRGFRSASGYARELGIDTPLIVMDGGLVQSMNGDPPIHRAPLRETLRHALLRFVREMASFYIVYSEDQAHLAERFSKHKKSMTRWGFVPEIAAEETLEETELFRIIGAGFNRAPLKALMDRIDSLNTRDIFSYVFSSSKLPVHFIDIRSHYASKGYGLKKLIHHLGLKKGEVISFGDFLNDVQLFQESGVRVAMSNAVPKLKEMADHVTQGSNDEGGAAEVLEMLG